MALQAVLNILFTQGIQVPPAFLQNVEAQIAPSAGGAASMDVDGGLDAADNLPERSSREMVRKVVAEPAGIHNLIEGGSALGVGDAEGRASSKQSRSVREVRVAETIGEVTGRAYTAETQLLQASKLFISASLADVRKLREAKILLRVADAGARQGPVEAIKVLVKAITKMVREVDRRSLVTAGTGIISRTITAPEVRATQRGIAKKIKAFQISLERIEKIMAGIVEKAQKARTVPKVLAEEMARKIPVIQNTIQAIQEALRSVYTTDSGLKFSTVSNVGRHADCVFCVFESQLVKIKYKIPVSCKSLRQAACHYVRSHRAEFPDVLPKESVSQYIERMAKTAEWVGHGVIEALALMLGVKIVILQPPVEGAFKDPIVIGAFNVPIVIGPDIRAGGTVFLYQTPEGSYHSIDGIDMHNPLLQDVFTALHRQEIEVPSQLVHQEEHEIAEMADEASAARLEGVGDSDVHYPQPHRDAGAGSAASLALGGEETALPVSMLKLKKTLPYLYIRESGLLLLKVVTSDRMNVKGNYFFRVLERQVVKIKSDSTTMHYRELRQQAVNYVYRSQLPDFFAQEETPLAYIDRMARKPEWVDHVIIKDLALMLDVKIVILQPPVEGVFKAPIVIAPSMRPKARSIFLYRTATCSYLSVESIDINHSSLQGVLTTLSRQGIEIPSPFVSKAAAPIAASSDGASAVRVEGVGDSDVHYPPPHIDAGAGSAAYSILGEEQPALRVGMLSLKEALPSGCKPDSGLKFSTVSNVGTRADCFFHVLEMQSVKRNSPVSCKSLRQAARRYVKNHRAEFPDVLPQESVWQYIERMAKTAKWLDHGVIRALALMLGVKIVILQPSVKGVFNVPLVIRPHMSPCDTIFLYQTPDGYYHSIDGIDMHNPLLQDVLNTLQRQGIHVPPRFLYRAAAPIAASADGASAVRVEGVGDSDVHYPQPHRDAGAGSAASRAAGSAKDSRGWNELVHGEVPSSNPYTVFQLMERTAQALARAVGMVGIMYDSLEYAPTMEEIRHMAIVYIRAIINKAGNTIQHASAALLEFSENGHARLTWMDNAGLKPDSLIKALPLSVRTKLIKPVHGELPGSFASCGHFVVAALSQMSHIICPPPSPLVRHSIAPEIVVNPTSSAYLPLLPASSALHTQRALVASHLSAIAGIVALSIEGGKPMAWDTVIRAFNGEKKAQKAMWLHLHPDKNMGMEPQQRAKLEQALALFTNTKEAHDRESEILLQQVSFMAFVQDALGDFYQASRAVTVGCSLARAVIVPTSQNLKKAATRTLRYAAPSSGYLMALSVGHIAWTEGPIAALSYMAIPLMVSAVACITPVGSMVIITGLTAYGTIQEISEAWNEVETLDNYLDSGQATTDSKKAYTGLGVQLQELYYSVQTAIASAMSAATSVNTERNTATLGHTSWLPCDDNILAAPPSVSSNSTVIIGAEELPTSALLHD